MLDLEIRQSINYASIIQNGVLPKKRHFDRLFKDHFVLYKPAQVVSGDFYWVTILKGNIFIVVGDCTGHGVPGAMLSMLAINIVNYSIQKNHKNVSDILKEIDKKFIETFGVNDTLWEYGNDWIDLAICKIDKSKNTIEFGGAHKKIFHGTSNGIEVIKGNNYPIGGWQIEKSRTFETTIFDFKQNDILYLGSDGFQDQLNNNTGKKIGSKRLKQILNDSFDYSLETQKILLENELELWKGDTFQTDDVCIVGVRL